MAVLDIVEKIKNDGADECARIGKEVDDEVGRIKKEAQKSLKEFKKNFEAETLRLTENTGRKILVDAEQKAKQSRDLLKRQIVDEVFLKAEKINEEELKNFLTFHLSNITDLKNATLTVPENMLTIVKKIVPTHTKIESGEGIESVMVKTDNGEYDLSFSRFIRDARAKLEVDVTKILFEGK